MPSEAHYNHTQKSPEPSSGTKLWVELGSILLQLIPQ